MDLSQLTYVRREKPGDVAAVRAVLEAAFGQPDEAALVDALRARGAARLSLVAAFMVAELRPGVLAGRRGVARYQPEFSAF